MEVADSMRSSSVLEHQQLNSTPTQIHYKYNPPDGEFNIWMYAMIGVGSSFIIFVIASIYLMCKSPAGGDHTPLRRHPTKTTRDRTLLPPVPNSKDHL